MEIVLYEYPKCSTCRKAIQFLASQRVGYTKFNIVETPPNKATLKRMLTFLKGDMKKLFNTSGELYREMGLKDRLDTLDSDSALELLSNHGKLVKRPFLLGDDFGLVGFNEDQWRGSFQSSKV